MLKKKTISGKKDNAKILELKKKSDEIMVEVINLSDGIVKFESARLKDYIIFNQINETQYMPLSMVIAIANEARRLLETLKLGIVSVDHPDYKVKDILSVCHLDGLYSAIGGDILSIDEFLIKLTDPKLAEYIGSLEGRAREFIIARIFTLYKEGNFDSYKKQKTIASFGYDIFR